MIRLTLLYISMCLLGSCGVSNKSTKNWDRLIEGTWGIKMLTPILYERIELNKGGAVIYTTGDTIYMFAFELKKNDLLLRDRYGIETHNKIIKLTKDTLIFATFLEETMPQVYIRETERH